MRIVCQPDKITLTQRFTFESLNGSAQIKCIANKRTTQAFTTAQLILFTIFIKFLSDFLNLIFPAALKQLPNRLRKDEN